MFDINQIQFWLMFDENCFFSRGAPAVQQSGPRDPSPRWAGGFGLCTPTPDTFFKSTYPEMQRKHIPRVNEYQSWTRSHLLNDWYQTSTRESSGWHLISNARVPGPWWAGGTRAARQGNVLDPGPPVGRGGSSRARAKHATRSPRWVGGAPAAHQSDAAPSGQEEPAACQSGVRDPGNRWAGRASAANQSCVRAPSPRLAGGLRLPARASCAPRP